MTYINTQAISDVTKTNIADVNTLGQLSVQNLTERDLLVQILLVNKCIANQLAILNRSGPTFNVDESVMIGGG